MPPIRRFRKRRTSTSAGGAGFAVQLEVHVWVDGWGRGGKEGVTDTEHRHNCNSPMSMAFGTLAVVVREGLTAKEQQNCNNQCVSRRWVGSVAETDEAAASTPTPTDLLQSSVRVGRGSGGEGRRGRGADCRR